MASSHQAIGPEGIAPTARCPRGIGLVFLDLDGTIVNAGVSVSSAVEQALREAHDRGCVLAVSSGRPWAMMPRRVLGLGVMDYYLCSNGAALHDADGATLERHTLTQAQVLAMMDALDPLGASWNVHSGSQSWIERNAVSYMVSGVAKVRTFALRSPRQVLGAARGAFRHFFGEKGKAVVGSVRPVVLRHPEFEKVGCSFRTAEACTAAIEALGELGGLEVVRVWERELEITPAGVTKGAAAEWLEERLGIARERTVAFGDSMNDAPLMGHVGRFVAMGNASAELRAQADEVCDTLAHDGVARWLQAQMAEADVAAGGSA